MKKLNALEFLKKKKERYINMEELLEAIDNSSDTTAIYVGGDSKVFRKYGKQFVAYVICVVIHIDGNAGGKLYKQITIENHYGSTRQRLMHEVYLAGALASDIAETVGERPFEIHLDINSDDQYASSVCIKEATGYILGTLGFKPKLKPEAFAASTVSDRYAVKSAG